MCPAPSMGSDGAEMPQTRNKAKARQFLCTNPHRVLTFQDVILLSSTTGELARSLETDGEVTPPAAPASLGRPSAQAKNRQSKC